MLSTIFSFSLFVFYDSSIGLFAEYCDVIFGNNPINLLLKWTIIEFDDFQILTIELQKRINMYSGKLNVYWNSDKNQKIKLYKWITCETEESYDQLEEMFLPNEEELAEF